LCCNPRHLFLGTHAENMADMKAKGRQLYGERHNMVKLTEAEVVSIRISLSAGYTQTDLARRYGVTFGTIHQIKLGKTWRHVA
jgi:predicted DNA-binding protein (UPF0251 family)